LVGTKLIQANHPLRKLVVFSHFNLSSKEISESHFKDFGSIFVKILGPLPGFTHSSLEKPEKSGISLEDVPDPFYPLYIKGRLWLHIIVYPSM